MQYLLNIRALDRVLHFEATAGKFFLLKTHLLLSVKIRLQANGAIQFN